MKAQINSELLKLQEELGTLDSAVSEITKAGKLSETIIENTRHIHKSYEAQLDKVQQLYSEFLNKTYHHTENNVRKIFEHFQEKIQDEEKILEKYTELSIKTEDLTHEYLKSITDESKKQIINLINDAGSNLEEQKEILKLYVTSTKNELQKLIDSHNNRIAEEEKILTSYLDLAQSTAKLTDYLKNIDFDEKLDKITQSITEIKETQATTKKQLDDISEDEKLEQVLFTVSKILKDRTNETILAKTKKSNKKMSFANFMLILIFLINFIFFGFVTVAFWDTILSIARDLFSGG